MNYQAVRARNTKNERIEEIKERGGSWLASDDFFLCFFGRESGCLAALAATLVRQWQLPFGTFTW